jgi:hypothetical protein
MELAVGYGVWQAKARPFHRKGRKERKGRRFFNHEGHQLGVEATVKAQSVAASATRAAVTTTTTTVLNQPAEKKNERPATTK